MAVSGQTIVNKASQYLGEGSSRFCKAYGAPVGSAFCCMFVWYIMKQCSASKLFMNGGKTAWVPTAQEWLHKNCKWVKMADARPGDIVIFTWDGNGYNAGKGSRDHIGFIRKAGTSSTAYTIEGNTSGGIVANRTRSSKFIRNIYRPNYSTTTTSGGSSSSTGKLAVDKIWGKDTTRKSQKVFGTTQDGIVSYQPAVNRRYLTSCSSASWKFYNSGYRTGSALIKAIQRTLKSKGCYSGAIDGLCGINTVKGIQKLLRSLGYYTGAVDGIMGVGTVAGWQKYINSRL